MVAALTTLQTSDPAPEPQVPEPETLDEDPYLDDQSYHHFAPDDYPQ